MSGLMYASSSNAGAGASSAYDYDPAAERTFVSSFHNLPAPGAGLVRLFDRGTFFSAHGDDATRVADSVYRTRSVIKQLTGANNTLLPSVTLNPAAAKSFLRDALSAKQMRVEIYANGGGKRTANWTVSKRASPGNLQEVEDLLFAHSDMLVSPLVVAFKVKNVNGVVHVGAAFADATNRQLGVAEYADNELFSNTESLLIQVGAKECILPEDKNEKDIELQKLRTVVERSDLVVTPVKRGDFNDKDVDLDLGRLLRAAGFNNGDISMTDAAEAGTGTGVAALPESELRLAMGSLAALISYLKLTGDDANFGAFSLTTHDLGQFLRLDASAIRALSLFPDPNEGGGANRNASLFGLLNKCRTAQGTRLLAQWIKQPLRNLHAIQERQDLVELFLNDVDLRSSLQDEYLKVMPDLQRLSKRLQRGVASLEDVVRIYQAALRLPGMIEKLSDARATANFELPSGETSDVATTLDRLLLSGLEQGSTALENLVAMVEEVLDLDELARHSFVIKPAFDSTLTEIRKQLDQIRDGLDSEHQAAARELGLEMGKKLHLEQHAVYGHVLRVTRNEAKALRTATKNKYHELATQKNGVYFRTRALKELSDDFAEQTTAYEQHQRGVVTEIIATAATYCATLEQLNVVIATLDVLLAFAYVSGSAPEPYVKPKLVVDEDTSMEDVQDENARTLTIKPSSAPLHLTRARHACVEASDDITFIPNDVNLVPGESEFTIITGPNMGGKSTFIRMVGVIAILAQIGCFVPTSASDDGTPPQVPVFDSVLCRVGAGDNQTKGVSTFMAEMLETATILRTATRDSLIIIDELGRGTSTYDGFGLAWAISHHIATHIRAKCLFATHFHELTTLANQLPYVRNLHVVAHVEGGRAEDGKPLSRDSITLLYQVAPGVGDQSFGIHVAELAHFPPSIIRLAKRKVKELEGPEGLDSSASGPASEDEEAGAKIVEDFMAEWARRSVTTKRPRLEGGIESDKTAEAAAQKQLLRKLLDEWKDKFEGNAWVRNVLASF